LRGYNRDGVVAAIREAGGEIYAITSEPQSLARNAQEHWQTGFEHVGDPHQEILRECTDRGWLSLFRNHFGDDFVGEESWVSHPKGYFQPGVLALNQNARVLYRWRCRPNRQNVGGARMRPTSPHVWTRVQAALAEPSDAPDVPHDDNPTLDAKPTPWPVFVLLLISNGWFLRPTPFDQRVGGVPIPTRVRNAGLRIPFFFAGWIAAFIYLPVWIAGPVLLAWIAKITPGIRMLNRRFQNVGPGESPAPVS
jgi:hypothetical protein